MRALAAIMVLVLHSKIMFGAEERASLFVIPGFSDIGYYGVELFFVISGFIIAHVVSKAGFDLMPFFVRRALRIYPLWWIVMSVGLAMYFWRSWTGGGCTTTTGGSSVRWAS
jgi:peptidoglycan/LPS O-acetylase OafA/YrhL